MECFFALPPMIGQQASSSPTIRLDPVTHKTDTDVKHDVEQQWNKTLARLKHSQIAVLRADHVKIALALRQNGSVRMQWGRMQRGQKSGFQYPLSFVAPLAAHSLPRVGFTHSSRTRVKGAPFTDVRFLSSDMSLVQVGDVTCPGACRSTGRQHPSACTLSRV